MGTEVILPFSTLAAVWLMLLMAAGIACLWVGGNWLTDGATALGLHARIDPILVGLTIVSVATSFPELLTSLLASAKGSPDLATGNIVGSNIANIGLILGVAGLFWPFAVHSSLIRAEMPILIGVSVLFCLLGFFSPLGRIDGILLLLCMVGYFVFIVKRRQRGEMLEQDLEENVEEQRMPLSRALLFLLAGGALLALGSDVLVNASVETARRIGISELLIGITIVAVGTSLPELAATVAAGLKRQSDIVAGNIVGSNLFNLMLIGGSVAVVEPLPFSRSLFRLEIPAMLLLTLVLWGFFASGKRIRRREGGLLLGAYVAVIAASTVVQA